jgi:hypothetical protein
MVGTAGRGSSIVYLQRQPLMVRAQVSGKSLINSACLRALEGSKIFSLRFCKCLRE